ncbi:hypothetical protein B0T11DRAFT_299458 [Plectosphaerella cucumerina]|uniref:Uncharacterized protein n=1 Tax=Plectosphaerella cucumerina TaxID=40658 RepID=A0A8K0X335_9PEZI|nr:hypothetical protein B0T11DRAFT_299458 [Plectosphaerella cucumerina]
MTQPPPSPLPCCPREARGPARTGGELRLPLHDAPYSVPGLAVHDDGGFESTPNLATSVTMPRRPLSGRFSSPRASSMPGGAANGVGGWRRSWWKRGELREVSGGVPALSTGGHMGGRQDLKGGLLLTFDPPVWRPSRVSVPGNRGRSPVTEGCAGACQDAQLYPPTCHLTAGYSAIFQLAQGVLSDPSDKTKINLVCGLGNDSDIMFKDLRDVTPPTLQAQTRARISRSRVNLERDSRSRASESILGGELRLDMEGLLCDKIKVPGQSFAKITYEDAGDVKAPYTS